MSNTRSRLSAFVALAVVATGGAYWLTTDPGPGGEPSPEDLRVPETAGVAPTTSEAAPPSASAEPNGRPDGANSEVSASEIELQTAESEVGRTEDPPEEEGGAPWDYEPMAQGSLDFPNMRELDPTDPAYDPHVEAQQAFAPMEQDLLAADPLDPSAWREALERHKLRNAGVSKRAQFLLKSGHPELAEDLLIEWSRVYGSWQARAYGRAGPPGYKSPPP
jgi:hypothetical protein